MVPPTELSLILRSPDCVGGRKHIFHCTCFEGVERERRHEGGLDRVRTQTNECKKGENYSNAA